MRFRPHILRYVTEPTLVEDSNGNLSRSDIELSDEIQCRYIPNGSGRTLVYPDDNGEAQIYSYTILLDRQEHDFQFGDILFLYDTKGNKIGEYKVLKHFRYQLYEQIWV